MAVLRQLSVFLKNEPGVLARLCHDLAKHGINILGLSVSDTVDHAVVRLVVSDPAKAQHLLEEHGVLVVETDVLALHVSDKPGELGHIADKLAKAKVNIEYAYGTACGRECPSLLILRVSDLAKARRLLKAWGA